MMALFYLLSAITAIASRAETITIDYTDRLEIRRLSSGEFQFLHCHYHDCFQVGPAKTYTNAEMNAAVRMNVVPGTDMRMVENPDSEQNGSIATEFLYQTQRDQAATFFVMGKISEGSMAVTDDFHDPQIIDFLEKARRSKAPNAYVRTNVDHAVHQGSWGCPTFCDKQFLDVPSYVGPYSKILKKLTAKRKEPSGGKKQQKTFPEDDDILKIFNKSL